ncbi:MAG: hypothetical protein AYK23_01360 [Candidatus Proteinoplasmatales archaeon SG8-5]|nr:MAG: hypothetical protein AYK23_01360 [Candidatus Proteinoplasmatales archaeon SG8-5]
MNTPTLDFWQDTVEPVFTVENLIGPPEASTYEAEPGISEPPNTNNHKGPGDPPYSLTDSRSLGTLNGVKGVAGLGNWSFRDAHRIPDIECNYSLNGTGIVVGIADTGVDFCKTELQDSLERVGNLTVTNATVVTSAPEGLVSVLFGSSIINIDQEKVITCAIGGETLLSLNNGRIVESSLNLYRNNALEPMGTGEYSIDLVTGDILLNEPLQTGDNITASYSYYQINKHIIPNSYLVYRNSTLLTEGTEYTMDTSIGEITFVIPLNAGAKINITYSHTPINYGWPAVLDVESHREYVAYSRISDNSWFCNTTLTGSIEGGTPPTFEYFHSPAFQMNGRETDFNMVDRSYRNTNPVSTEGEIWDGEAWIPVSTIGGMDFDLTNLYVSRDYDNWYFGFETMNAQLNRTYGLYIDLDNVTSGAGIGPMGVPDPQGHHVDAESSHTSGLNGLAHNQLMGLLASCSDGQDYGSNKQGADSEAVFVWTENDGSLCRVLTEPDEDIKAVAWSHSGNLLVASSRSRVYIWNATTWDLLASTQLTTSGILDYLSISPDDSWVALPRGTSRFTLINISDEAAPSFPTNNVSAGGGMTQSVAFNPSGNRIAVGMDDGTVRIFDTTDYSAHELEMSHENIAGPGNGHVFNTPVRRLAWSPDGTRIASGGDDGRLFIWDSTTGAIIDAWTETPGHQGPLTTASDHAFGGVVWSTDRLVVGTWEGTLVVINTLTSSVDNTVHNRRNSSVNCICTSGPWSDLFVGSEDTTIRLYDMTASAGNVIQYESYYRHKPDVIVYIPYDAETYVIDENGDKVIGQADAILDPLVYRWTGSDWNLTSLSDHGEDLYFYKGNKELSSESQGLTETTLKGFVEMALPRAMFNVADDKAMSVELFVVSDEPSVAQDTVPSDHNVGAATTDFQTSDVRSLSSLVYVDFPETTIDLPADLISKSGTYHYGIHPSKSLSHYITNAPGASGNDYVGVLVVDAAVAGMYDTVIVDLNSPPAGVSTPLPNYVFDTLDPVANRESPFLALDIMDVDKNIGILDGVNDFSAGVVYYISDGENPLPYSHRIKDLEEIIINEEHPMPIPGNGDIVCLFGEFEMRTVRDYVGNEIEKVENRGTVAATVIAANGRVTDPAGLGSMAGVATGVKLTATGRSGKYLRTSLYFLGEGYDGSPGSGDEASVIYVGVTEPSFMSGLDRNSHALDHIAVGHLGGKVTFVLPAGNDGPGYGTISSPAPHNGLVVGAAKDNAYDSVERQKHIYGEIAEFSARGPTAAGAMKPDLIAIGMGRVSQPLTLVDTPGGHPENFETYRDTAISASVATGVVALVQQAYEQAHPGTIPTMDQVLSIIKSSATDKGYDVLTQGSGYLNAPQAVELALGSEGIQIGTSGLVPSNYWDSEYYAFPKVVLQGTAVGETVGLTNHGPSTDTVISAERLCPVWTETVEIGYISGTPFLLNLTNMMPRNITLLRMTAMCDADEFYDETTMKPVVAVKKAGIFVDWANDLQTNPLEEDLNLIAEAERIEETSNVPSNVIELELGLPNRNYHSNIWFILRTLGSSANWTLKMTGYAYHDWDWVTIFDAPGTLSAGEEGDFTANVVVPGDARPGSYSGVTKVLSGSRQVVDSTVYAPPVTPVITVFYEEVNPTSNATQLQHGQIVAGSEQVVLWKTDNHTSYRYNSTDNNAVYIMNGTEVAPWGFSVPILPVVGPIEFTIRDQWGPGPADVFWGPPNDPAYGWIEGVDYIVDNATGYITINIDGWDPSISVCEFYVNYSYLLTDQLSAPADYVLENSTGSVTFKLAIGADIINITANYSYYVCSFREIVLPHTEIESLGLTRYDVTTCVKSVVTPAEYEFFSNTGIIRFISEVMGIYYINATYQYYEGRTILPMLVNVGMGDKAYYEFGGGDDSCINSPCGMSGGYCFGISDHGGDRRYFYVDLPEEGMFGIKENFRSYLSLDWERLPTDIDVTVYAITDDETITYSDNAAPYFFEEAGRGPSSPSDIPANFTTSSGGTNETVVFSYEPGLNVVCLRTKLMNGTSQSTPFSGKGGYLRVTDQSHCRVSTNKISGQFPVTIWSNVDFDDGLTSSVLGPAVGKTYSAEEVEQDEIFHDITQEDWWTINANAKYLRLIDVEEGTLSLDVQIIGHTDCPDLDLCLFYDGKCGQEDGVAQWDEYIDKSLCDGIDNYGNPGANPAYAYSAGAGSNEATKVIRPKPGVWIVKVVGYDVKGSPGHFDLIIKMIKEGVKGYELSSNLPDIDPVENIVVHDRTVPRFNQNRFDIHWDLPERTAEDGSYSGILSFGNLYSPGLLPVPIDIYLDRVAPVHVQVLPGPGSVTANPKKNIVCIFSEESGELDGESVHVTLDGKDVSSRVEVSVKLTADSNGKLGYWGGSAVFAPHALTDGGHVVTIRSKDFAGNLATTSYGFTVDTKRPVITFDGLSDTLYTNQATFEISGKTETDALVNVLLGTVPAEVKRDPTGKFRAIADLEEGDNILMVNATDKAGNEERRTFTVVRDSVNPTFERAICLDGSLTNQADTIITGSVSEVGTMSINGCTEAVNSDGSFKTWVKLTEGVNPFAFELTDLAGNTGYQWLNVTLDTRPPIIYLDDVHDTVEEGCINISGTVEAGSTVTINGKPVRIDVTRQQAGSFGKLVQLSPGPNTLVVEARDQAGNSEVLHLCVTRVAESGTNYAAIGLMILLLVIGLVLGLYFARLLFGEPRPSDDVEESEDELEDKDWEPAPDAEAHDEVLAEDEEPEELSTGARENDTEVTDGGEPEDISFEPEAEEPSSDGLGFRESAGEMDAPEAEEAQPDTEMEDAESEDELEDSTMDAEEYPGGALSDEPHPDEEDPRIVNLKQAFHDGKISKDLYEKNLRRLSGE